MKKFLLFVLILCGALFSCQKSTESVSEEDSVLKQETIETGRCFNFVYPITIVYRGGSTATIENNQQFRRVMAACGEQRCFGFVYPLSVVFRGGNTVTGNNDFQMERVYNSCD